jgi:uncharacterized cupredoxin-like copper-binding protein
MIGLSRSSKERKSLVHRLADRPFYTRVAVFGTLLYLTAVGLFFVAFLLYDPAEAAFGLSFLLPGLLVVAALAFMRRGGLIVGVLGGALGLLIFSEGIALILSVPYSFFDFTGTVMAIVGCLILLLASAAGLIESFQGAVRASAKTWEIAALRGLVAVLAVVAVVSAAATLLNMESVSAADRDGATVLTARETEWDIDAIEATAGKPLKIVVRNDDPFLHTFTVHDLDIDLKLGPNSERLIVIEPQRAGVFGFICRVTGHGTDMSGLIDVK